MANGLVSADRSVLVVVDIQERLAASMERADRERVVRGARILLEGAGRLSIPVIVTEQYPKGLGPTEAELIRHLPEGTQRIAKTTFSAMGTAEFRSALEGTGREEVVVAGMESHVCVLQTAMELGAQGFSPFVAEDACCSRLERSHASAMNRLRSAGVAVTLVESVLFEWLRDARHEHFKTTSALIR